MTEVVRSSAQESSGWACRSRRTSTSWSDCASTPAEHCLEQAGMVDWGSGGHNGQEYRPEPLPVADGSAWRDGGEPEDEPGREHPVAAKTLVSWMQVGPRGHEDAAEPHLVAGLELGELR